MAEIAPWSAFGHTMSTAIVLDGSLACLVSVATEDELDPAQLGHSTAAVGLLAQMIVLRRDIERLRQELHDLQQDRSLLTAGLHHDLKGPLTSILGSARTLIARYERLDDELRMDLLAGIVSRSERLNRMLTETLDRQSSDPNAPVRRMKADLKELTERAAAAAMSGRNGDVVVECEPICFVTDPDRLERALLNLLDNALKYSPPETAAYLIVEREGASVSLTVADNGPGVSPDVLPGLFTPYATDPTRTDGTGLGLHSVRILVEELGGRVGYARHSGWTRFTMTLPAEDEGDDDPHA
jgi:signal transduction histidine kinase